MALWARRRGPLQELATRRRLMPILSAEHAALAMVLASGAALMVNHGWVVGRARWLDLKLGLVAFLVLPLELMHAYVAHIWMARGLRGTRGVELHKDLSRGLGIEEMLRTIGLPLLGIAFILILWLSLRRPF
jgi:hypothetical protein